MTTYQAILLTVFSLFYFAGFYGFMWYVFTVSNHLLQGDAREPMNRWFILIASLILSTFFTYWIIEHQLLPPIYEKNQSIIRTY